MALLYLENEEEHEYLYNFMSNNFHGLPAGTKYGHYLLRYGNQFLFLIGSAGKFLKKTDFPSDEDYSSYVFNNISPGMLVKCVSVCGHQLRPSIDEGRVLDYEDRDYIGLAVKVQWKTGRVRWYPAQNLQIGGFRSQLASTNNHRPAVGVLTLEEEIFEPGDQVRIRTSPDISPSDQSVWQNVQTGEIGIISGLVFENLDSKNFVAELILVLLIRFRFSG